MPSSRPPRKPSRWPTHIRYINSCSYHSSIFPETRSFLQGRSSGRVLASPSPSACCLVSIRPIVDALHPACKQHGLFAAQKIPINTRIMDYIGEVHCDDRPNSDYDLSLHRTADGIAIGIDASIMGNEARFINDYRGIRKRPNAIFSDTRSPSGELRMSIWSCSEIKKGEEILVSYGKSWWLARSGMNESNDSVVGNQALQPL